jgi:hypothetical protein
VCRPTTCDDKSDGDSDVAENLNGALEVIAAKTIELSAALVCVGAGCAPLTRAFGAQRDPHPNPPPFRGGSALPESNHMRLSHGTPLRTVPWDTWDSGHLGQRDTSDHSSSPPRDLPKTNRAPKGRATGRISNS